MAGRTRRSWGRLMHPAAAVIVSSWPLFMCLSLCSYSKHCPQQQQQLQLGWRTGRRRENDEERKMRRKRRQQKQAQLNGERSQEISRRRRRRRRRRGWWTVTSRRTALARWWKTKAAAPAAVEFNSSIKWRRCSDSDGHFVHVTSGDGNTHTTHSALADIVVWL